MKVRQEGFGWGKTQEHTIHYPAMILPLGGGRPAIEAHFSKRRDQIAWPKYLEHCEKGVWARGSRVRLFVKHRGSADAEKERQRLMRGCNEPDTKDASWARVSLSKILAFSVNDGPGPKVTSLDG